LPRPTSPPSDHAHEVRTLVATADRRLAAWARERLPAAGMTLCDDAQDAEGAVRLAGELRPEICLLDVTLPGDAMEALRNIRERAPATRLVMLAGTADDPVLLPALRAGARGCVVGTPDGPALKRTLSDVLAGHTAMPRAVLTRLVAGLGPA
jgi:DNA-binding NarL/FixJ family response regulator